MSTLPRFGSSTRLNNLFSLDTSHAAKAREPFSPPHQAQSSCPNQEHRSKRVEASPQTARSAPAERSKYQLWPAVDQAVQKPLPGPPDQAVVPTSGWKRSVRVHQSADQIWLVYGRGDDLRPPQSKHSSKRSQASPKISAQPTLDVGT